MAESAFAPSDLKARFYNTDAANRREVQKQRPHSNIRQEMLGNSQLDLENGDDDDEMEDEGDEVVQDLDMHEADHSPQRKPLRGGGHGRDPMDDYEDEDEEDFGGSIEEDDYHENVGRNDGFGAFYKPNA